MKEALLSWKKIWDFHVRTLKIMWNVQSSEWEKVSGCVCVWLCVCVCVCVRVRVKLQKIQASARKKLTHEKLLFTFE